MTNNTTKNSIFLNFNSSLSILFIVIVVYSILSITTYLDVRLTADSMLYFSIAEKYLKGDFHDAVNGYWGPLLAWLLIPFLYSGISDVVTINAINLIFGILTIIGVWFLSYRFELTERIRSIILISLIPVVLKFSVVQPMDFLLACILVFYLCIVFKHNYPEKISSGMSCGVLGALAYFSKSYAFPFFIAHFLTINILHYIKSATEAGKRDVMKNAIVGFVLFFLIGGVWIIIISNKYGYYTFSTMNKAKFSSPSPEALSGGLEFGVPVFYEGFFAPPNETAFVVWEDPSYLEGKKWNPWDSWSSFNHFIKLILKNISEGLHIFETFSTLSIVIILAYILLLSTQPVKDDLLYPLLTLILYSGGYVFFHFEERYLWIVNILLLLMGGYLLNVLFQKEFFNNRLRKNILIVSFIISFIFTPSRYIIQVGRDSINKDMYYLSTDLKKYNIRGNIASNREYVPVHDAWHKTFRLAYWLKDSKYYGQARLGINDEGLRDELNKYNIDYYFLWGDSNIVIPQFLHHYKELTNGEFPNLRIYSLKENK